MIVGLSPYIDTPVVSLVYQRIDPFDHAHFNIDIIAGNLD